MKHFIVFSDGCDKEIFTQISNMNEFDVHPSPKITQEELTQLLPKINGIVIRSATKINQEFLESAKNLKYVIRAGIGTDNIDKEACKKRGISVSNTPGGNTNSAAEHAIALMFTVLRKTALANLSMSQGKWEKPLFTGMEIWTKKIGIIGMGNIGKIVAKRLSGFEPQIIFYDPTVETIEMTNYKKVASLEELFSSSDIISLHLPLVKSTHNLITKKLLDLMPSHAIIVNASRGKIVNEDALYQALKENKIRGAGFDVFASEPLESDSKLRTLSNLVLTPHLGAATIEAQERIGEMALHQLKEFFINNNLLNEVTA
jgi:D-3-phosphoglycerate dehydrogenase